MLTYTQVRRSRKPFTCDACGEAIPVDSSYRHRQFLDRRTGRGAVRRWHDECPPPPPLDEWLRHTPTQLVERRERAALAAVRREAWDAQRAAVRERLDALGVRHSLSAPRTVRLSLDEAERLLDLAERP